MARVAATLTFYCSSVIIKFPVSQLDRRVGWVRVVAASLSWPITSGNDTGNQNTLSSVVEAFCCYDYITEFPLDIYMYFIGNVDLQKAIGQCIIEMNDD